MPENEENAIAAPIELPCYVIVQSQDNPGPVEELASYTSKKQNDLHLEATAGMKINIESVPSSKSMFH